MAEQHAAYVEYALKTLQVVKSAVQVAPAIEHVTQFRDRMMESNLVTINFPDGSGHALEIDPSMNAADIIDRLVPHIGLQDREGFGIFQVGMGLDETYITEGECLLDCLAAKNNNTQYRFIFKRRMWLNSGLTTDPTALSIMYHQALLDVCNSAYQLPYAELVKLIAIHRAIVDSGQLKPIGDENRPAMQAVKKITLSSTATWNETQRKQFIKDVEQSRTTLTNPTPDTFLNILRKYKHFAAQCFSVRQDDMKELPTHLLLGINLHGVFFIDTITKAVVRSFRFAHVTQYANNPVRFCLRVYEAKNQTVQYNLHTTEGKRITQTIKDYICVLVSIVQANKAREATQASTPAGSSSSSSHASISVPQSAIPTYSHPYRNLQMPAQHQSPPQSQLFE